MPSILRPGGTNGKHADQLPPEEPYRKRRTVSVGDRDGSLPDLRATPLDDALWDEAIDSLAQTQLREAVRQSVQELKTAERDALMVYLVDGLGLAPSDVAETFEVDIDYFYVIKCRALKNCACRSRKFYKIRLLITLAPRCPHKTGRTLYRRTLRKVWEQVEGSL